MRKFTILVISLFSLVILFTDCKKKEQVVIPDNEAPYNGDVSKVKVENFVNRLFIDLLGREPLDAEMDGEVAAIKSAGYSRASREALITKLMTDQTYRDGDSSYYHAYYNRFFDLTKVRILDVYSDEGEYLAKQAGILENYAYIDSLNNDLHGWAVKMEKANKLRRAIKARYEYRNGVITIQEVYRRLLDNDVFEGSAWDNMYNVANYARNGFNALFFRNATQEEILKTQLMAQNGQPEYLLGMYGQSLADFYNIVTQCEEFNEGLIRYYFKSYLGRDPNTGEMYDFMTRYGGSAINVQQLQKEILSYKEYANF